MQHFHANGEGSDGVDHRNLTVAGRNLTWPRHSFEFLPNRPKPATESGMTGFRGQRLVVKGGRVAYSRRQL